MLAAADVVLDAHMIHVSQPLRITSRIRSVQYGASCAGAIAAGVLGGILSEEHLPGIAFLVCGMLMAVYHLNPFTQAALDLYVTGPLHLSDTVYGLNLAWISAGGLAATFFYGIFVTRLPVRVRTCRLLLSERRDRHGLRFTDGAVQPLCCTCHMVWRRTVRHVHHSTRANGRLSRLNPLRRGSDRSLLVYHPVSSLERLRSRIPGSLVKAA